METLYVILSWTLCGLIVGLLARLLVPGRQALGILGTILVGVLGAFVGGAIYWAINRHPGEPFSFSANAWSIRTSNTFPMYMSAISAPTARGASRAWWSTSGMAALRAH